jgi:hypothetical protein
LLIGKDADGSDFLARAHQGFVDSNNAQLAARCAFWLGFTLLIRGESARAGGWLSRASPLLDGQPDCVEKGYLLLPTAYRAVHSGDTVTALTGFARATAIGEHFGQKGFAHAWPARSRPHIDSAR